MKVVTNAKMKLFYGNAAAPEVRGFSPAFRPQKINFLILSSPLPYYFPHHVLKWRVFAALRYYNNEHGRPGSHRATRSIVFISLKYELFIHSQKSTVLIRPQFGAIPRQPILTYSSLFQAILAILTPSIFSASRTKESSPACRAAASAKADGYPLDFSRVKLKFLILRNFFGQARSRLVQPNRAWSNTFEKLFMNHATFDALVGVEVTRLILNQNLLTPAPANVVISAVQEQFPFGDAVGRANVNRLPVAVQGQHDAFVQYVIHNSFRRSRGNETHFKARTPPRRSCKFLEVFVLCCLGLTQKEMRRT